MQLFFLKNGGCISQNGITMKRRRKCISAILLLHTSNICCSQYPDSGSWKIFNIKLNINEKWSVFGEAQLRSLRFYNHFHYPEYKGGVNFKAYPTMTFTLGAGDYDRYKEGGDFIKPKK